MPTYEYLCEACEHAFEEFQAMSDKLLRKCPKCGKPKLRRLFGTGAGIIFKGSGFYETDYRKKSGSAASESKSESKPESKSDSKSDSKADSKSDSKRDSKPDSKSDSRPEKKDSAKPAKKKD
jgi:putative FmdB family regulatory protein